MVLTDFVRATIASYTFLDLSVPGSLVELAILAIQEMDKITNVLVSLRHSLVALERRKQDLVVVEKLSPRLVAVEELRWTLAAVG